MGDPVEEKLSAALCKLLEAYKAQHSAAEAYRAACRALAGAKGARDRQAAAVAYEARRAARRALHEARQAANGVVFELQEWVSPSCEEECGSL